MVDIMHHIHKYVPLCSYSEKEDVIGLDEAVDVPKANIHTILFGGDQLTACRARCAKKVMANGNDPIQRLEGLKPTVEDWHTKVVLLEVNTILYIIII